MCSRWQLIVCIISVNIKHEGCGSSVRNAELFIPYVTVCNHGLQNMCQVGIFTNNLFSG